MTTCTCPACREPTRYTPTADGVPLPTASTPPRVSETLPWPSPDELGISPMEGHEPPSWKDWAEMEGENV